MSTQSRAYIFYLVCVPLFILLLYFISDYFYLKILTAFHSSFLLEHLFLTSAEVTIEGHSVYINNFEIIRECTGIQASIVFVGIVLPIPRRPWKRKILALTLIVSFVYISNVFRVAFEIWLIKSGFLSYELAHYPLSLALGIIGVFVLVLVTEQVYPQFPEFIMDIVKMIHAIIKGVNT